jgi:hypothetical protein
MVRHSAFLECKHVFEQVISGYVELFFIMPARRYQPENGFAIGMPYITAKYVIIGLRCDTK